jgi:hypothetical protein
MHFNIILPAAFQCSLQVISVKYTVEPWFSFTVGLSQSPVLWVPGLLLESEHARPQHVACLHTPVWGIKMLDIKFLSVTRLWHGCRWFRLWRAGRSETNLNQLASSSMVFRGIFLVSKEVSPQSWPLASSSAEVKNEWLYHCSPCLLSWFA